MATVIQIKRSSSSTAPTTGALSEGEMAYAQDKSLDGAGAILYIESVNNDNTAAIHKVGGKYYTDLVDSATSAKTNGALVKRDGAGAISADVTGDLTGAVTGNVTGDLTGDSAGTHTGAVVGNVTGDVSGNAGTASAWATARTLTLTGDAAGTASIDGSGDVSMSVTVTGAEATSLTGDMTGDVYANNGTSKVLENGTDGTDATFTGAVTGNASTATTLATARTLGGVSFDGSANIDLPGVNAAGNQDTSGNAATATGLASGVNVGGVSFDGTINITLPGVDAIGNQDTTGNAATATALETARAISVSGDATGTVNFDGSAAADIEMTLANSGVTAGTTGSATAVPVITVDAKGRVTAVSSQAIATSFDITDGTTTDTVNGGETLTFEGVANETDVVVSGNKVTVGMVANPTIGGNLTVSGDLTVSGTTTQVNTTNMAVEDSLVSYATGNAADAVDIGFTAKYNDGADKSTGFFRDANDGKWHLFTGSEEDITGNVVDKAATGYAVATLIANIEGDITGNITGNADTVTNGVYLVGDQTIGGSKTFSSAILGNLTGDVTGSLSGGTVSGLSSAIAVADGGTGATTHTSNGIVFGNGTGALQATAEGTNGYILYSNNGTPDWTNTLDGGSY